MAAAATLFSARKREPLTDEDVVAIARQLGDDVRVHPAASVFTVEDRNLHGLAFLELLLWSLKGHEWRVRKA